MASERDRETARVVAEYGRQASVDALRVMIIGALTAARMDEREACAVLAERDDTRHDECGLTIAAAIRARGEG